MIEIVMTMSYSGADYYVKDMRRRRYEELRLQTLDEENSVVMFDINILTYIHDTVINIILI